MFDHNPQETTMPKTEDKQLPPLTKAEREQRIKDAQERKKAEATKPGVVKPGKTPSLKIPAKLNMTTQGARVDDTSTVTEKETSATERQAIKKLDGELDATVAKKPAKKERDPNVLTVSEVAAEAKIDPKRARARLRALGKSAVEGRWPTVKRDSPEHTQLLLDIAEPAPKASEDDDDEE